MFLRAGVKTYLSKKYSHHHPSRPRVGQQPRFLGFSLGFFQSECQEWEGQVRSAAGCRRKGTWGSWNKGRNYQFRKPDTMAIEWRQENCLRVSHRASAPDSYLSDTEGCKSADTITPIH